MITWTMRLLVSVLLVLTENGIITPVLCRNVGDYSNNKGTTNNENFETEADELKLSFEMDGQVKSLNLKKNSNIPSDTPVYVVSKGSVSKWTDPTKQEVSAYFNPDTRDALSMSTQPNGTSNKTEFMGTFYDGAQMHSLMPMSTRRMQQRGGDTPASLESYVVINGKLHVAVRGNREVPETSSSYAISPNAAAIMQRFRRKRSAPASSVKRQYVVDYAAVIDYAIYYRWFSSSQETTDFLKQQDALRNIRTYYAYVVNEIDLRYSMITASDFGIRVRFVGYIVATTPEDSSFTESANIAKLWQGDVYTNAFSALAKFADYVANNSLLYSEADHVALFTGNYLYNGTVTPQGPAKISGVAYVSGVCDSRYRVSISREFGQYSTTQSATHELGHNLGSGHDGDSNTCNSQDQFIMAVGPGVLSTSNFNNPFQFSACSIASMRTWLTQLTSLGRNDLLSNTVDNSFDGQNVPYPGQTYNASQQCQQLYGPNSFYCAGDINDQMICSKMLCWDANIKQCVSTVEQRAFDGTTCGNGRWCQMGKCVYDQSAPLSGDTCVYGDYRGLLTIGSRPMSCDEIKSNAPSYCYDNYTSSMCCKSCASLRLNYSADCPYGDRSPDYCAQVNYRSACYDNNFQSTCCATCQRKKQPAGDDGCAYGDKVTWCTSGLYCYSSNALCCQSCKGFYTGVAGCEYGDKVTWCSRYSLSDSCKDPNFASNCCGSCAVFTSNSTATSAAATSIIGKPSSSSPTLPLTSLSSTGLVKQQSSTSTSMAPSSSPTASFSTPSKTTSHSTMPTVQTTAQSTAPSTGATSTTITGRAASSIEYPTAPITSSSQTPTIATTKTVTETTTTTTTTPAAAATAPKTTPMNVLIDKQGYNYCSTLFPGQCFDSTADCCRTCNSFFTGTPGCEYGDTVPWCRDYVKGPNECLRPEVAQYCCKTCTAYQNYNCTDSADWCSRISASQCYDSQTRATCCATCSRRRSSDTCCPYGDKYSWCSKDYCSSNGRDCCSTCATLSQHLPA